MLFKSRSLVVPLCAWVALLLDHVSAVVATAHSNYQQPQLHFQKMEAPQMEGYHPLSLSLSSSSSWLTLQSIRGGASSSSSSNTRAGGRGNTKASGSSGGNASRRDHHHNHPGKKMSVSIGTTEHKKLVAPTVVVPDADDDDATKATIPSSVFNLVNNVAGAGILTLSAGMATGTGWIPSCLICAILGWIGGHTFKLIGEACELTGERDFKGLWGRTIGKSSTFVVDAIVSVMCLAVAVIYSGILGDVFTPLLGQAGLSDQWNGRTSNILVITAALLLPMSLIKNMSALAFTSILGFTAIIYTVFFIVIRALDGSYASTSSFLKDGLLPYAPSFAKSSLWNFDFTSLVLASNLGLAYIAHYNGPTFYRELRHTNSKRFGKVVSIAFTILVALYIATMTAGYKTFGDVCKGNILLNYHPHDILALLGRLATGFSILFGFPLVACGAREGIAGAASSLGFPHVGDDRNHFALVATILLIVTAISCTVRDVSLVVGLTGAAMGSFIVYICPALIYTKAVALVKGPSSPEYGKAKLNLALIPFGAFIGALGIYMTIKESLNKK